MPAILLRLEQVLASTWGGVGLDSGGAVMPLMFVICVCVCVCVFALAVSAA